MAKRGMAMSATTKANIGVGRTSGLRLSSGGLGTSPFSQAKSAASKSVRKVNSEVKSKIAKAKKRGISGKPRLGSQSIKHGTHDNFDPTPSPDSFRISKAKTMLENTAKAKSRIARRLKRFNSSTSVIKFQKRYRHSERTKKKISESLKRRNLHQHIAKGSLYGAAGGATLKGLPVAALTMGTPSLGIPLTVAAMGSGAIDGGALGALGGTGTYYIREKLDKMRGSKNRYEYSKDFSFVKNIEFAESEVKAHTRRTKKGIVRVGPFRRIKRYFNPEPAKGSIYTAPVRYGSLIAESAEGKFKNLTKYTPNPKEATERVGATLGVAVGRADTLRKKIRDRAKDFTRGLKIGRRSEGLRDSFERYRIGENVGIIGGALAVREGLRGTGAKSLVKGVPGVFTEDVLGNIAKSPLKKKLLLAGGGLALSSQLTRMGNRYAK